MLTFCIITLTGSFYLKTLHPTDGKSPIAVFQNDYVGDGSLKWTIEENSDTGAYRICSFSEPK